MMEEKIEFYVKELEEKGSKSEYIEEIEKEYPYLLGILKNPNMKFNENREKFYKICNALQKTDNYCPCVLKRNEDTICPCKKMREESVCICGLYNK